VFQQGFRLIRELAALPEDTLVGEYDTDPVYAQRRLKELFVDICTADPGETWSGYERYQGQLKQRKACRRSCARPSGCAAITTRARSRIRT
jgi:hypothetical protein